MDTFVIVFMHFLIYSFLGWVAETIYCSTLDRKFAYRGFLNGPYCPIYGFGALLVISLLKGFAQNILMLFAAGFVLTSILEYITSFIMEKMFNMRWWDYSKKFLNINGRVCLLNSTLFGLLSVFAVKLLYPTVVAMTNSVSKEYLYFLTGVFSTAMVIDLITTVTSIIQLKGFTKSLEDALSDALVPERIHIFIRRLLKSFPNLTSLNAPVGLSKLKNITKKYKENLKNKKQLD